MKKKIIVAFIGLTVCLVLTAQNTPFRKFQEDPLLKTTFVTKIMMEMAPDMQIGKVKLKDISNKIDQVEIYTNKKPKGSRVIRTGQAVKRDAVKIVKDNGYELLMQLNDDSLNSAYYTKSENQNKEIINDLIIINTESVQGSTSDHCDIIRLVGKFTIKDIKKIIGK